MLVENWLQKFKWQGRISFPHNWELIKHFFDIRFLCNFVGLRRHRNFHSNSFSVCKILLTSLNNIPFSIRSSGLVDASMFESQLLLTQPGLNMREEYNRSMFNFWLIWIGKVLHSWFDQSMNQAFCLSTKCQLFLVKVSCLARLSQYMYVNNQTNELWHWNQLMKFFKRSCFLKNLCCGLWISKFWKNMRPIEFCIDRMERKCNAETSHFIVFGHILFRFGFSCDLFF